VLPSDVHLVVDRSTWTPHPIFGLVGETGQVALPELEKTFNMGVGMVALVDPGSVSTAIERLAARGVDAWVLGEAAVRPEGEVGDAPAKGGGGGAVTLVNHHAG